MNHYGEDFQKYQNPNGSYIGDSILLNYGLAYGNITNGDKSDVNVLHGGFHLVVLRLSCVSFDLLTSPVNDCI